MKKVDYKNVSIKRQNLYILTFLFIIVNININLNNTKFVKGAYICQ
jgi:hypothetical protein